MQKAQKAQQKNKREREINRGFDRRCICCCISVGGGAAEEEAARLWGRGRPLAAFDIITKSADRAGAKPSTS